MSNADTLFEELKIDINERQEELNDVQKVIDDTARKYSRYAKWYKVAVIILGALVTTREVADKIIPIANYPMGNNMVLIVYTAIGLAITVIGGITAAFGYERKSAELKVLATKCNACMLVIDSKLPKKGDDSPIETQIASARELIAQQNVFISEMQGKAAELGIDIVRKVRRLTTV